MLSAAAGVAGYSEAEGDLRRAIQLERDRSCCFRRGAVFSIICAITLITCWWGFRDLTETDGRPGALFLPVSLDAMNITRR